MPQRYDELEEDDSSIQRRTTQLMDIQKYPRSAAIALESWGFIVTRWEKAEMHGGYEIYIEGSLDIPGVQWRTESDSGNESIVRAFIVRVPGGEMKNHQRIVLRPVVHWFGVSGYIEPRRIQRWERLVMRTWRFLKGVSSDEIRVQESLKRSELVSSQILFRKLREALEGYPSDAGFGALSLERMCVTRRGYRLHVSVPLTSKVFLSRAHRGKASFVLCRYDAPPRDWSLRKRFFPTPDKSALERRLCRFIVPFDVEEATLRYLDCRKDTVDSEI
eukprot:Rmarinus@m.4573